MEMDERVDLILQGVRRSTGRGPGEGPNQANIRHMEEFFAFLRDSLPIDRFTAEVQPIPRPSVRTTDRNFIVTVPGRSDLTVVWVAHYDTWAAFSSEAPGADDNTTGEEILKHYLLLDLCADFPPALTHVYLFSGSEECGARGLVSQAVLTAGLTAAATAVSSSNWIGLLLSLPFLPFAFYRFGITGTRQYVKRLTAPEKERLRAAIAVDAVGEGRLYILENEMGATFLRALVPYRGSEPLNNLLKEGAHLHGIRYNVHLAGGTTDSVAFLEEPGIPAAALVSMAPGKSSPFVAGGKLHTRHDTPDRVRPESIRDVLSVLDHARRMLSGGERPPHPRRLSEHHYARLYRDGSELFLALKDAAEPNRRNLNSIFRVQGGVSGREARIGAEGVAWWGVETSLGREMRRFRRGSKRIAVDVVTVTNEGGSIRFTASRSAGRTAASAWHSLRGWLGRLMGGFPMAAMFLCALVVSDLPVRFLLWAMVRHIEFGAFLFRFFLPAAIGLAAFQLAVLFRLFTRTLPAAMDNAYRHQNRADNLMSLHRDRMPESAGKEPAHRRGYRH
jgi:hypothetical protein